MGTGMRARVAGALLSVGILGGVAARAAVAPAYDTEWWQEVDLTGMLSQHLAYLVTGVSRLSDHDPNPALTGAEVPSYRGRRRPSPTRWAMSTSATWASGPAGYKGRCWM
jgi:hypothetical protein